MPDAFAAALAQPGLGWLIATVFVAGAVRGFAGFGTAMIYLPVAAQFVDPVTAVIALLIMDLFGPMPVIPRALREGDRGDLLRLVVGMAVALPFGIMILFAIAPEVFQIAVSVVSLVMLGAMVAGLRFHGVLRPWAVFGTGGLAGLLGGAAGTPGPPVILLYMASAKPSQVVRANITAFLFFFDIAMVILFAAQGRLESGAVVLGLVYMVPNVIGVLVGSALFRPGYERVYRSVAYAIIGASGLSGLVHVVGN